MMTESTSAALFRGRRAPRIIAQEDLELRRRGLDEATCVAHALAPDEVIGQWARVLELSFVFGSFMEAVVRLGIQTLGDLQRDLKRLDSYVRTVTRLDIERVMQENAAHMREQLESITKTGLPPPETPVTLKDIEPVVSASRSLLENCPIQALEQRGARAGLQELSHRCRLAFDGLASFVARNSKPQPTALAAAGQAYAEGRLSIDEVAAVLGSTVPDAVALLEENGYCRGVQALQLTPEKRRERLAQIRADRLARGGVTTARPEWTAREVIASQRIEDIDARPWLRS